MVVREHNSATGDSNQPASGCLVAPSHTPDIPSHTTYMPHFAAFRTPSPVPPALSLHVLQKVPHFGCARKASPSPHFSHYTVRTVTALMNASGLESAGSIGLPSPGQMNFTQRCERGRGQA
eukprot:365758-Chlamydomonas_euryale.AAC.3